MSKIGLVSYPWDSCPRLANAASLLTDSLSQGLRKSNFVTSERSGQFEFETRFATFNSHSGKMENGVTEEFYNQSLEMMQECQLVTRSHEVRDYYYYVPTENNQTMYVRTRVEFPNHSQTDPDQTVQPVIHHIVKHKIFQLDFDILNKTSGQHFKSHSVLPHSIRCCLNWEETIAPELIPKSIVPVFVRIIQPCQFLYINKNNSIIRPIWSYDFAKTWSGPTAELAEIAQKSSPPIYEIEAECMDPIAYMKSVGKDESYAATSLLLKTCDFLDFSEPPLENYVLVPKC